MKQAHRAPIIAGVAAVLVIAAVAFLVLNAQSTPESGHEAAEYVHPQLSSSQTCTSCKASQHDYKHLQPYGGACETCHTTTSWRDIHYVHEKEIYNTGFHGVIGCAWCHTESRPVLQETKCQECHGAKSPHEGEMQDCATCHTTVAWALNVPVPAGHVSLIGGHAGLSCFMCHSTVSLPERKRSCVDCHGTNHGGLSNCEDCHDPAFEWRPKDGFDHATFFVLEGRHSTLDCASCHPNGRFAGTPATCAGCHGTKHGGLTACQQCHSPARAWARVDFDHNVAFKLTGRHRTVACYKCHVKNVFAGTPKQCVSCHGQRHGGLTECAACHTTAGFTPATFDHSTRFVLTGAHAKAACTACHAGSRFSEVLGGGGTQCGDCHSGPHGASWTSCADCHTTTAWAPIKALTHPGTIRLGVQHQARTCKLCHPTLQFADPTTPCQQSGCHAATITHVGPTDCLRCHRPTQWSDLHFTHVEMPMHEGTNLNSQCLWCHAGPDYSKYDCKECHVEGGIPWYDPFAAP